MAKPLIKKFFYFVRNLRSKDLFDSLRNYCHGSVLDVGGWDFYRAAIRKGIRFDHWTVLEPDASRLSEIPVDQVEFKVGDGCAMTFRDESFDTVINIQVLEHVFEPISMIQEMQRVLKKNGHLILLIPQTARIHMAPNHYYNFTRFWIQKAMEKSQLSILQLKPIGGVWSSMASHLFYFFFQSFRYQGTSIPECRRNIFYYSLYPFMFIFASLAIPICLLFSLGDLSEEPNNHLVIAKKN